MARQYGKITFPEEGLNLTLAEFTEAFGSSEDFRNTPEENRKAEIKKAFDVATKGNTVGKTKPESSNDE